MDIRQKPDKIRIICKDCTEKAVLHVSVDPNTFECMDPFIPEGLQLYIASKKGHINHVIQYVGFYQHLNASPAGPTITQ